MYLVLDSLIAMPFDFTKLSNSISFWFAVLINSPIIAVSDDNGSIKDVRFLKIAHFEKCLEIKNIYDLDKNFYGNSHCVNAFQASRYLRFGQKNISNF